jgi:hypothetical protein
MTTEHITVIPENKTGKEVNLEVSWSAPSVDAAISTFERASFRLKNPAAWKTFAGKLSSDFELRNIYGPISRLAEVGDYIRVNLPLAANGGDWVRVEAIETEVDPASDESVAIRLRPSPAPASGEDHADHFFDSTATSTLMIRRSRNLLSASYHGRNETVNTKEGNLMENLRNSFVSLGAMLGYSELQWKSLLKGFLSEEIGGDLSDNEKNNS